MNDPVSPVAYSKDELAQALQAFADALALNTIGTFRLHDGLVPPMAYAVSDAINAPREDVPKHWLDILMERPFAADKWDEFVEHLQKVFCLPIHQIPGWANIKSYSPYHRFSHMPEAHNRELEDYANLFLVDYGHMGGRLIT